jgi:D-erythro-7,8-dihydroneopterin triphosphate epimerase
MNAITIRIKNLKLRTIIGINDDERINKQDILINVCLQVAPVPFEDKDTDLPFPNYRTLTKKIIQEVEKSQFFLLEKLTEHLLDLLMEDTRVIQATLEIDKPHALRFADSVSITMQRSRD